MPTIFRVLALFLIFASPLPGESHAELNPPSAQEESGNAVTISDNGGTETGLTANAGPDQTVPEETTVFLSGSASGGGEGPMTYGWTQLAGPRINFSATNEPAPSFIAPDVGPENAWVELQLTVTDAFGAVASDTVAVRILNDGPGEDGGCFLSETARWSR